MSDYCPNCSASIHGEDRFCGNCGEQLVDGQATESGRRQAGGRDRQDTPNREENRREPTGQTVGGRARRQSADRVDTRRGGNRADHWESTRRGPTPDLPRQRGILTLRQSVEWLVGFPVLIGAFLVAHLAWTTGELAAVLFVPAFALLLFVSGVAYLYVDRFVRERRHGVVPGEQLGRGTDEFFAALSVMRKQFVSLLGVGVAYVVAVIVGLVFFIIPGIYVGARLLLAFPACVIDRQTALESLEASWKADDRDLSKFISILVGQFLILGLGSVAVGLVSISAGELTTLENMIIKITVAFPAAFLTGVTQLATARVYLENRPSGPPLSQTGHRSRRAQSPGWEGGPGQSGRETAQSSRQRASRSSGRERTGRSDRERAQRSRREGNTRKSTGNDESAERRGDNRSRR